LEVDHLSLLNRDHHPFDLVYRNKIFILKVARRAFFAGASFMFRDDDASRSMRGPRMGLASSDFSRFEYMEFCVTLMFADRSVRP